MGQVDQKCVLSLSNAYRGGSSGFNELGNHTIKVL